MIPSPSDYSLDVLFIRKCGGRGITKTPVRKLKAKKRRLKKHNKKKRQSAVRGK